MTAERIDGTMVAAQRQDEIARQVAQIVARGRRPPCLAAVSVGDEPPWRVYQRRQQRIADQVGIVYRDVTLAAGCSQEELDHVLQSLNQDAAVDGIILQTPLPAELDLYHAQSLLEIHKDVEGVNPANLGLVLTGRGGIAPCTARSAVTLAETACGDLRGIEAVVVGSSVIVGKPAAELLLNAMATVTVCHIATQDVAAHTRRAELVIVAVGKPGLLTSDMLQPGVTVIDVGINRVPGPDGKSRIVGDVASEVWQIARAVSPVPGGVGSLTTTILFEQTLAAFQRAG